MLAIATCLAAALAAGASAQTRHYEVTVRPAASAAAGYIKTSVSKATVGDATILLWENTAIDPDCSVQSPGATLTILEAPEHGEAKISDEPFYLAFPPNNPRSACNSRKIPGHRAFYTATAGFKGRDHLVLQGTNPAGNVRRIDVKIDVR
jgi:hypothetical protein